MKRDFLFAIVLFCLLVFTLANASAGSIKIIRFWAEFDYAYALVDYINDTMNTYEGGVTISCVALNSENKEIGNNQRSFSASIRPGFQRTMEIPVRLHGEEMKSMSCHLIER